MEGDFSASGGALIISHDKIPFTAYQAIYHKLTKRTEIIFKHFSDPYRITADNLINLSHRLDQTLAQFQVKGRRTQIIHSLHEGASFSHSSVEKFKLADMSHHECTSSFDFELDFLVVLPAEIEQAEDIAQRYKLNINYERSIRDGTDLFSPFYLRGIKSRAHLSVRLEYSDYAVAQSVMATINAWLSGIPARKVGDLTKSIMRHEESLLRHIPIIIGATAPLSAAVFIISHDLAANAAIALMLISIVLLEATSSLMTQVVENGYSLIRQAAPDIEFILTEGDTRRTNEALKKNSKVRSYIRFALVTVITSLVVNTASSWLWDHMSK